MIRSASWLRSAIRATAMAAGVGPGAAEAMADVMTEAHLRGVETHGIRRLGPYVRRVRAGGVDPGARPRVEAHGPLLLVDGCNGVGHLVGTVTADVVAAAAARHGLAVAWARNSNHFGFAGYYATRIASHGHVALVSSNGQVCVAPPGSGVPVLSNDPLAIAAPMGGDGFFELDMALSETSRARVVEAARRGKPIPRGWAVDRAGRPTCDPSEALAGALAPFGGPKGFALLLSVEMLTGVLGGGRYADQVVSKESSPDQGEGCVHLMLAIDVARVMPLEHFQERLQDMIRRFREVPTAGGAPARYPGQRRWELRRRRLAEGVPLDPGEIQELEDLARALGADLPPLDGAGPESQPSTT